MSGRFDEEAIAERPPLADPSHGLERAGHERQPLAVQSLEPFHDLRRDLLGRIRHAEHVAHVPRPLRRAHAHHGPLRVVTPATAAFLGDLAPRLVPQLLGVEQDAVEIEDDGLDHSYFPRRWTSASRPGPRAADTTSPTKNV